MAASAAAPAPADSASASAKAKPRPSGNSTIAGVPSATASSLAEADQADSAELAATAPIFVHILFVSALLILITALIRSIRAFGRARVYGGERGSGTAETQWPTELGEEPAVVGPASTPTRIVRALFGGPPAKPPPTSLPSYTQALQQSARQQARREAAEANVPGYTAGRRGREIIGTGDAEDLEVEVRPRSPRLL